MNILVQGFHCRDDIILLRMKYLLLVLTSCYLVSAVLLQVKTSLHRTNAENSKQIFPEKELRGHSPNFHIHVSVSDLYIPTVDHPILLQDIQYVDRSWEYISRSQKHECGKWD